MTVGNFVGRKFRPCRGGNSGPHENSGAGSKTPAQNSGLVSQNSAPYTEALTCGPFSGLSEISRGRTFGKLRAPDFCERGGNFGPKEGGNSGPDKNSGLGFSGNLQQSHLVFSLPNRLVVEWQGLARIGLGFHHTYTLSTPLDSADPYKI